MITIITNANRHEYEDEMDQMFRLRHRIFVEQLGWKLPEARDGKEIDRFDTEDAIYLLSLDGDRKLLGSKRLLPTTQPHLMSEVFPHMVAGDVPAGPHIWESSRSCVHPDCRDRGIIGHLFLAMVEVGLIMGIEKITFVADMAFYPTILHAGWGVAPLGFPQVDETGAENIAACLTINPISLRNMRHNYQVEHSMLNHLPLKAVG
ncbi:acyl-homoserine-lactone synthase [Paremcibacter congregatus]|uniref:acyl-homoserine-lactone synthase n=1 Tax=Paremcibacter congregatus TaxID=2043170 RepID=UPI0030EC46DB|tara:strand:- start:5344 stop:5958 length:615 start_codon:yes stop_codon:yes gene_type:complete